MIWLSTKTERSQCLQLLPQIRWNQITRQNLHLFVDTFSSKWRQIMSLSDMETIGQIAVGHQRTQR